VTPLDAMQDAPRTAEQVVPPPPTRAVAVASAMAVGAALATAAVRPTPGDAEVGSLPPIAFPVGDPAAPVAAEAAALLPVIEGLLSGDAVVRRETAGVVERLAADPDPRVRLALAAALRALGGRAAALPLALLAGDEDVAVRLTARRALLDSEGRER
jgi:hypothetical protein